jgi:hypothetical protein
MFVLVGIAIWLLIISVLRPQVDLLTERSSFGRDIGASLKPTRMGRLQKAVVVMVVVVAIVGLLILMPLPQMLGKRG